MKQTGILLLVLVLSSSIFSREKHEIVKVRPELQQKIISGLLIDKVSRQQDRLKSASLKTDASIPVILYFEDYPSRQQIRELRDEDVVVYKDTWTPPVGAHKLGFMIAHMPSGSFESALSQESIRKIDYGGRCSRAMNNEGTRQIKANDLWRLGTTGKGVKVGVLDSGIDISYAGTEFPSSFIAKDYSAFPEVDDDVRNQVTGHGTHVAGTVLGSGILSEGHLNSYNGEGPFKGAAPDASLVFLKIGSDSTGWSNTTGTIAAIDAAIDIYDVDVLTMSYGGWDAHHDGTSADEQKVDWACSKGVPFFCSAGNSAWDKRHWSGTVAANSESDFIQVNCNNADSADTKLWFNLVWNDGNERKDITVDYYDSDQQPLNGITKLPATESTRGTESEYSYKDEFLPKGTHTYYLKIKNNSTTQQLCHIYDAWDDFEEGNNKVKFENHDPFYTIGAPASADSACAVGAYVSRPSWMDSQSRIWDYNQTADSIAFFSSRGPRVDGLTKPDICAPGYVVISVLDKDVNKTPEDDWISNSGTPGDGECNYQVMAGTSMACPFAAGAAALYLQQYPNATPWEIYQAFKQNAQKPGLMNLPNNTWGSGKLNLTNAFDMVNHVSPPDEFVGVSETPDLHWENKASSDSYHVQVASDKNFDNIVFEQDNIPGNSVNTGVLEFGQQYYWRVNYSTGQTKGIWSAPWSFTTGNEKTGAGYAFWFDGKDDYIEFPHSDVLNPIEINDEVTIEAWIFIERWNKGFFPVLENFINSVDWGWSLLFNKDHGAEFNLIWSSSNSEVVPECNKWVHVATAYSQADKKVKYYLNGELVKENDFEGDIPNTTLNDPVYIGQNISGGDEFTSGWLDEIRVWDVARTGEEIKNNMFSSLKSGTTNLKAHFSFDEGSGSVVSEATGNYSDGAIRSLLVWTISSIPFGMPDIPALEYPANNQEQVTVQEMLNWSALANCESFQLEVAKDQTFSEVVFSDTTITKSWFAPEFMQRAETYYWRVKSVNRNGSSDWSDVFSFSTEVNTIATLNNIMADGTGVTGFDRVTFEYDIMLPNDTMAIPAITATPTDTNATVVITQATQLPGKATIEVTAEDGVTKQQYAINFEVETIIHASLMDKGSLIKIFPNPAANEVNIQLPYFLDTGCIFEIYDLNNRKIAEKVIPPGIKNETFNVSKLSDGIYSCRLTINDIICIKKLIIQS